MKIVVTGFGIFRDYTFNPSWEAVSGLPDVWDEEKHSLHCEQIPVEYDFVLQKVPAKWSEIDPDFIVHVGVSHLADKLTLEKQANNTGYDKPDVRSLCPPDQRCVPECSDTSRASCLDMEKLMVSVNEECSKQGMGVEACVSEDAGHYLCDFVYFKSLHSMSGKSLFVHVPEVGEGKPYSVQQMTRGLSVIIKNIINMSRISDVQGLFRGLGKIGSCGVRRNVQDVTDVYQNIYVQPVIHQAIKIVLDIKEPSTTSSASKKSQGLDLSQAVGNIPLVLQGMGIFANIMTTGSSNYTSSSSHLVKQEKETLVKNSNEIIVNTKVSALDLLEFDLTNESLLKEKIYINLPSEEKSINKSDVIITASDPPDLEPDPATVTKLSSAARERRVPASRISRVASFASLGVGLGLGIVAEASRRVVSGGGQGSGAKLDGSLILNEANAERIVATLCRVRGAALKLGQMLSIQDGAVVGPELQKIFDRVRESADFMPEWQLESVMVKELGEDWRDKFREFHTRPFAAASIGQVHYAEMLDGSQVAVKVQYPGVAKSIDSDIRNVLSLVSMMAMLPKGLFLDKITAHMKVELAEECDYVREAECGRRMREVLAGYPEYYVPVVFPELSSGQVLTSELITGLTIDKCAELDQRTRNFIAESILKLVFRELFLHRYMQTDPNWANFLYNPHTGKVGLLDFGATREYRAGFVNTYFKIIDSAAKRNREDVLKYSREVGFLTGYESQAMNDAHVDSVMLLAVPFHENKHYNFGDQTITREIQDKTSVMLKERLCPPPQEVYSLHRKLSGLFLLAGKLNAEFNCYVIWQDIRSKFKEFPE